MTTTPFRPRMIEFAGQRFVLDPDRAAHWPDRRTLIVADVHFGKSALFRERGVPVPAGTTAGDLCRLDRLIDRTQPRRLLILGDCFHGRLNDFDPLLQQLEGWRRKRSALSIELVRGNHDRHVDALLAALDWTIHRNQIEEDGIRFAHEPTDDPQQPTICGHIHPAVTLRDFDGHGARVPCFVVDDSRMILPAFGGFTGTAVMPCAAGRRFFAVAGGRVVPLNTAASVA